MSTRHRLPDHFNIITYIHTGTRSTFSPRAALSNKGALLPVRLQVVPAVHASVMPCNDTDFRGKGGGKGECALDTNPCVCTQQVWNKRRQSSATDLTRIMDILDTD